MAPIATHSPPNAQTAASVKLTNASASPPVNLNPAVFVHAQSKTNSESHTTIAINPSNLSDATTVCAWFFDSSIPHNELTTALGQMLQSHPLYSGRIVEIFSNGLVKIELSNEGVPLSEGKAPSLALNDLVPSLAQGGNNYVVSTASSSSLSSSSHLALTALLPMHSPLTTEALRNQRAPLVVASHVVLADGASVLALRFWSHLFGDRDGVELLLSEWILPGSVTPVACCVIADGKAEWRQSPASVQKPAPEVKVVGEVAHDTDAREATADYELV
ncbi:hypothetical protein BDZ88DRAFT_404235 [Geranomyces variabilis]|nr:hypothetical protein BDZ88DRAFT_404235 [Geranomyces variabilis]KAJ3143570.1 hypothetical protein HDU90_000333 [Geranomyces variabilis]